MKPAPFVHHAPGTVDEAVAALGEVGAEGKVLAGGQSLIPLLNMRLASPAHVVDINRVPGLDRIEVTDDAVRVGALVRHSGLERSDEAYAALPLLREATRHVAHPAIRNRGTTVGSLAHADPAGEMPAVLVLTDGVVEVVSSTGSREVRAADFFVGPLETILAGDELAVAARFGRFPPGTGTAFTEAARRNGDYALAGVAAAVRVTDGAVRTARVALVSVTDVPTVIDVTEVMGGAPGSDPGATPTTSALEEVVRGRISPEDDIHASAAYRSSLAVELTRRALATAGSRALSADGGRTA